MAHQIIPQDNSNYYTLSDHPFYFGHYLNHARHNAYLILKELYDKFEITSTLQEENLSQVNILNKFKNQPDKKGYIIPSLTNHFPFLKAHISDHYSDIKPEELQEKLILALKILHKWRNLYSHFGHRQISDWKRDAPEIEISKKIDLPYLFKQSIHYLKRRYGHYEEEYTESMFQRAETAIPEPEDWYNLPLQDYTISFFICLFLQRDEAQRFLSRTKFYQNCNETQQQAIRETYREFSCKLSKPKLHSSDILLDMINELSRCPKELYSVLSESDRNNFKRSSTDVLNEDPNDDDSNDQNQQEVVLKRHENRFPWFALRFLDDSKVFPTLRFQIQLANFAVNRYNKFMNRSDRERVLIKPIRVFSRWENIDITNFKSDYYNPNTDINQRSKLVSSNKKFNETWIFKEENTNIIDIRPEIEQLSPTYNVESNTVPFKFINKENKSAYPSLPMGSKINYRSQIKNDCADGIISTYELTALFLHQHLCGAEQTEKLIKEHISNFRKFIEDFQNNKLDDRINQDCKAKRKQLSVNEHIAKKITINKILESEYKLKIDYLPKVIQNHLLNYETNSYSEIALEKIKTKINETRKLLKNLGYNFVEKKPLKRDTNTNLRYVPKVGQMASWLASDIVYFMKIDGSHTSKPNNDQYNILQKMLAYYGAEKNNLNDYLKELNIKQTKNISNHPFILDLKILKYLGILEFYENYLLLRWKFLTNVLLTINPNYGKKAIRKQQLMPEIEIKNKFDYFLKVDNKKAQEKQYSNEIPILLPRNIFIADIYDIIKLKYPDKINFDSNNFTIFKAFEILLDGDAHEMYSWNHLYSSGDDPEKQILLDKDTILSKIKDKITPIDNTTSIKHDNELIEQKKLRRKRSYILEQEELIRKNLTEDRALWIMCNEKIKSSNILQSTQYSLKNLSALLNEEIEQKYEFNNVFIRHRFRIHRYGEIRKILKDRRLSSILGHFEHQSELEFMDIVWALEKYENSRVELFQLIYSFERKIYEKFESDSIFTSNNSDHHSHMSFLKVAHNNLPDQLKNKFNVNYLIELRNSILHNQFPSKEQISFTQINDCKSLVTEAFKKIKISYSEWLRELSINLD